MECYDNMEEPWDAFKRVSIHDHDKNVELVMKYRERSEHCSKFAFYGVEEYDRYIGAVYDYYNALGLCHAVGKHISSKLGVENYIDEMTRVVSLYYHLREKRSRAVRSMRRTGQMKKAGHECAFCKSKEDLHSHHIVPLYLGGTDAEDNFITVCRDCHTKLHQQISTVIKHVSGVA